MLAYEVISNIKSAPLFPADAVSSHVNITPCAKLGAK